MGDLATRVASPNAHPGANSRHDKKHRRGGTNSGRGDSEGITIDGAGLNHRGMEAMMKGGIWNPSMID